MTVPATAERVTVEAPARLHFGVLDLSGSRGRWFGGIGAAVEAPSLRLEAVPAGTVSASGPEADRVVEFARRTLAAHALGAGVHVTVHRAIPGHCGLGSGTQLGLAVARAVAALYGLPSDPLSLAAATGRGVRSAIGTWAFAAGGVLVEGGRRAGADAVAPLLARFEPPAHWRCVVAVPDGTPGLNGEAEAEAFRSLPRPPVAEAERVAHAVLLQMLPALAEGDLPAFGAALEEVQRVTGAWFSAAQGGVFAPGPTAELVDCLRRWGGLGVGQSSWGPAVYALADGPDAARALAARARQLLGDGGRVWDTRFAARGATVERTPAGVLAD